MPFQQAGILANYDRTPKQIWRIPASITSEAIDHHASRVTGYSCKQGQEKRTLQGENYAADHNDKQQHECECSRPRRGMLSPAWIGRQLFMIFPATIVRAFHLSQMPIDNLA